MRYAAVAALALAVAFGALAGCSKTDQSRASADVRGVGQSLHEAAAKVGNNPAVKKAQASARKFAADAKRDIQKAGAQARTATQKFASGARRSAHDVTRRSHERSNG